MSVLGDKILKLRSEGKTYSQIQALLNCSRGSISYHCGPGQKEKFRQRTLKFRKAEHPYHRKMEFFSRTRVTKPLGTPLGKIEKLLYDKIRFFCNGRKATGKMCMLFTVQDVIDKFGETPRCYLTGQPIDISKPSTYQFDHIIPRSRGGQNTLDNLGICTKMANLSKSSMTFDEFVNFCKLVVDNAKLPE